MAGNSLCLAILALGLLPHSSRAMSTDATNRIKQMLQEQQDVLYDQGRHNGGPYETNVDIVLQNPLHDNRDLLTVGGFVETDSCWMFLNSSDIDGNGSVSNEEFVAFAKLVEPDVLPVGVTTYEQLPLVYKLAFTSAACLCNNPLAGGNVDAVECCVADNANIRIPAQPSQNPNATEATYLYTACSLTQGAAEVYLTSAAPTPSPATRSPTTRSPVSDAPTSAPVGQPTGAPATAIPPSKAPVAVPPSKAPVAVPPSKAPVATVQPSPAPVSTSPSTVTSTMPSTAATSAPTAAPIVVSSASPSDQPTMAALSNATLAPSSSAPAPSSTTPVPSKSPTFEPVMLESIIPYGIAIANGLVEVNKTAFVQEYMANLVAAMDVVATDVASGSAGNSTRRQLRINRGLESVSVILPTDFAKIDKLNCPPISDGGVTNTSLCQTINAKIGLTLPAGSNDTMSVQMAFDTNLSSAIDSGALQKQLDALPWTGGVNPITVLSSSNSSGGGPTPTAPSPAGAPRAIQGSDALSSGAISGIALAALFFTLFPIGFYLSRRHRPEEEQAAAKLDYEEFEPEHDVEDLGDDRSVADNSVYTDTAPRVAAGATTLGASQAYYGAKNDALAEPGLLLDDEDDDDDDDGATSSNAGSSGWSSSAGISSLNTGSVDDANDAAVAAGATLAGIGLASAFSRNLQQRDNLATPRYVVGVVIDIEKTFMFSCEIFSGLILTRLFYFFLSDTDDGHSEVPSVSRDQLDSLIESGDWAAVGATAALLAAASDSQSGTSVSHAGGSLPRSRDSQSVDAARAAELDHLVDAGDWEGVVAAAAKFEAQVESGTGSGNGSRSSKTHSSIESSGGSGSNTGTNTAGSPSVTTTLSDTASKAKKREEVRSEVEALVRRVVPEEIDNVDEMMNQFKGREDELVETLRTMQERAVAQKARAAGHRAAKTEARMSVQRSTVPVVQKVASLEIKEAAAGTGGVSAAGVGMVAAASAIGVSAKNEDDEDEDAKPAAKDGEVAVTARSALEQAIEAGDWEAVGEAAAMISDNSVTTASSGEIARLADTNLSLSTGGSNRSRNLSGVNADRASELDALIDRGDWTGVVAAANQFSEADKNESEGGVRSQEEEDALKEAELWMKIANQKKPEGAMDAGASDAAEWAIQRSLSQLKEAEKKSEKKRGNDGDEDEV